jgi:hypothetical protein
MRPLLPGAALVVRRLQIIMRNKSREHQKDDEKRYFIGIFIIRRWRRGR